MFDVRITEIATKTVTNYFDVDETFVNALENALDSGLWELVVWRTPSEDDQAIEYKFGYPEHPDVANAEDGLDDGCMACYDSERYDDHMHGDDQ